MPALPGDITLLTCCCFADNDIGGTYLQINGQVQALCKQHEPVHFTAQGDDKTKSSSAPGLRCATCADLQSWFCHYIMKSKGSHGSMSLALRSYGSPLELALFTFSVFGIAPESDVVGSGGDLPLLCLFPMATHDKLKCRR